MLVFNRASLLKALTSSICAPVRWTSAGAIKRFGVFVGSIMLERSILSISTWYMLCAIFSFSVPMPLVAFAWGSISITRTRLPASARHADRLIDVVVLPTPPF